MTNRAPRLVIIGMPFKNRQGETRVPRAFIHPCFKEGCDTYAPWGFGPPLTSNLRFSCSRHVDELRRAIDSEHPHAHQ